MKDMNKRENKILKGEDLEEEEVELLLCLIVQEIKRKIINYKEERQLKTRVILENKKLWMLPRDSNMIQ